MLIDAYERLDTPVKLVFAGGSSYTRCLRRSTSPTRLRSRIRFLPWVGGDELEELLTNAMLFVLPSDMEGLSLALLYDAMGAGVSRRHQRHSRESRTGRRRRLYVPPRRCRRHLERVLQMLVGDPAARRSAAAAAKQRIRDHYLWSDIACRIEACILETYGEPRSRKRPTAA